MPLSIPLLRATVMAMLLLFCTAAFADTPPSAPPEQGGRTVKIDRLMEGAISRGLIAGGVVLVGNRRGVLFERAYGNRSGEPGAEPLRPDSIFDIASLTKVVATTPAVMKLAEERRLSLVDPLTRWFPEFAGKGKDELLVLNLLTHTSGLDDFSLSPQSPMASAVQGAAGQHLHGEPGNRFRYADINFILLGEMVERLAGVRLDRYAAENFFKPLGMADTGFTPPADSLPRCAATLGADCTPLIGRAQDYTARQLGGVAGHAGLFTTARDLARFCRMIMNGGELDGHRVLAERTVQQMTAPYFSRGGKVIRALGWDITSPFSAPRGSGFSESSFGHTGYSGSSVWIDPETDTFVVLLTSRLDYRNTAELGQLRGDLSTAAAALFGASPGNAEIARHAP